MKDFEALWYTITHRGVASIVQDYNELEHVYNLARRCKSYLEIGTAEGNSLYVISRGLINPTSVTYVDIAEHNTEVPRKQIVTWLEEKRIYVHEIKGKSQKHENIKEAAAFAPYDMVLIDADHSYESVIADAIAYGGMAKKYILFHDICLEGVGKAFDWYVKEQGYQKATKYINTKNFGYGVIEL